MCSAQLSAARCLSLAGGSPGQLQAAPTSSSANVLEPEFGGGDKFLYYTAICLDIRRYSPSSPRAAVMDAARWGVVPFRSLPGEEYPRSD